jgi:DNA-binding CsgD family transcriptional regulator
MFTKTEPKKWTEEQVKQLLDLKEKHSNDEIAKILDRSEVSISIKLKRLKKKNGHYNEKHVQEKYKLNDDFFLIIKPKTVLDAFSGQKSYYEKFNDIDLTTNDLNIKFGTNYHMDYLKLLCKLYSENKKYDLIDLDPFGSAYDGFDLAIKMAKKGIVLTLGELGHVRFKRLDFVRHRYDIHDIKDFSFNTIVEKIKRIGLQNKKTLRPVYIANWQNITRVYFMIDMFKVTEQWDIEKENEDKNQMTIFDVL